MQRTAVRRLVAMDIENINGGAVRDKDRAAAAWKVVADAIELDDHDQVVVGVGPSSLLASGTSHPHARFVLGRGLSGADGALVEVLREERVAERFCEVVIVSGDGIFANSAAELARQGVRVTVVCRNGRLSARLRLAAQHIVLLPGIAPTFGEAA
jgi:hypothetical protein